jgi:hypothetical protein
MAIGWDSVGRNEWYSRLFENMGMHYCDVVRVHMVMKDNKRKKQYEYNNSDEQKTKRAMCKNEKIRQMCSKAERDKQKGHQYGPSIALEAQETVDRPKKKQKICPLCGGLNHTTNRSTLCKKHGEYIKKKVVVGPTIAGGPALDDIPLSNVLECQERGEDDGESSSSKVDRR